MNTMNDPIIGAEIIITDEVMVEWADGDETALRGKVIGPSPAWINEYLVVLRNGKSRYILRRDFKVLDCQ